LIAKLSLKKRLSSCTNVVAVYAKYSGEL
jgi:hypothetical protein